MIRKLVFSLALSFTGAFLAAQDLPDMDILGDGAPPDGNFSEAELGLKSKKPVDLTIKTEGRNNAIRADIKLVNKSALAFELDVEGMKKPKRFDMRIAEQRWEVERSFQEKSDLRARGVVTAGDDVFKGYRIEFKGLDFDYFVKPNFARYNNGDVKKFIVKWEKMFPEYQDKTFHFEIVPDEKNTQIWLDGRLCGTIEDMNKIKSFRIIGGMGPEIKAEAFEYDISSKYLKLALYDTVYAPDRLKDARLSLKDGVQDVGGIPFNVVTPARSIEPARHRKMRGLYELVMDPYTSRTAFDFMPEAMHYSIPQNLYSYAHVLFAAIPGKERKAQGSFAVRLTRYGAGTRGRGGAISDNYFDMTKTPAKKVGTVEFDGKKADLLLAEIPLNTGSILDLASPGELDRRAAMRIGRYLDLEFLASPDSPAVVFGATLERTSLTLVPEFAAPGNIFDASMKPEALLRIYSRTAGNRGTLKVVITDADNKSISEKEYPLSFPKAVEAQTLHIDLKQERPGYYGIRYELYDSHGRFELAHNASFALLPADDREAGYESPFGVWVFGGEHNTESNIDKIGYLCLKAGFRKTTAVGTEEKMKPYKTTLNQILCFRSFNPDDYERSAEAFRKYVKRSLDAFPSCKAIDIFHEYGGIGIAPQMFGAEAKVNLSDPRESRDARVRGAAMMSEIIRREFPQLKILFGNSCAGGELVAWGLDQGLTEANMDYVGIETPAYHGLPERPGYLSVPATWCTLETVKKYARSIPASGCFEFTYRSERRFGDKNDHARHYMRDILQGLAFGYKHVTPGILDDSGAAYYHGNWGGSGYVERHPYLYPKRAYVAAAALTRALDKGEFIRRVDNASNSCYLLEFERKRKKPDFAYALWTPRYDAEIVMTFPKGTSFELIKMYGDSEKLESDSAGRVRVKASPSPSYLIAASKVLSAEAKYLPEVRSDTIKLAVPQEYTLFSDYSLYSVGGLPSRIPGVFELKTTSDGFTLELKGRANLPEIVNEYTTVRLNKPLELPAASGTGVWVDGNSSFGSILFELTDAEGKIWRSHASDESLVTFDGWHFIHAPLKGGFSCMTRGKTKEMVFPVKLNGLIVETSQNVLNPCEMKKVRPLLSFRDFSIIK